MPAKIIEFDEDQDVACPICKTLIVDAAEGLTEQPSCAHVRFVYANGEAFEFDQNGLETRLQAEQDKADEDGAYFDPWDALLSYCDKGDVILEQISEEMACGAISFKVWIGIRKKLGDDNDGNEFSSKDHRVFFHPTAHFIRWIKGHHGKKHIYEVGAGVGHVAKLLAKAGLHVTAIDLAPRAESEFPVVQGDSTEYQFEKDSVAMFCRPLHSGFVEKTLTKAIQSDVSHILYVGLTKNLQNDLGSIHDKFTKRRVGVVGNSDERVWELNVGRLRAEASLRRGIPRLSSPFVQ